MPRTTSSLRSVRRISRAEILPDQTRVDRNPAALAVVRLLVATLIAGLLLVLPAPTTPSAEAAVIGRMLSFGGWQVGAFVSSTGEYVYCVEPGSSEPAGAQTAGVATASLPDYDSVFPDLTGWSGRVTSGPVSGERLRHINYVLWEHGRTTDADAAVVVQLAIWLLRDDPGARAWLDHHLAWMQRNGGAGYIDAAQALASEARHQASVASRVAPGVLRIERDDAAGLGEHGAHSGVVRYPAGTTELSIVGARFADGSDRLVVSGGAAGSVSWSALPHTVATWTGTHRVSVTGSWQRVSDEWPAELVLFAPVEIGQQRLAAGLPRATVSVTGELQAALSTELSFAPELTTQVPQRFVAFGAPFSDTVTLAAAGRAAPWPSRLIEDGRTEFAPVVAEGVLYGPFSEPLTRAAVAPADAPIAARATLLATAGPGAYQVEADQVAREPGYYSWVWSIREEEQVAEVRTGGLLPSGYSFVDDFGLDEEGQVVPSRVRWSTALIEQVLDADRPVVRDRVTAEASESEWLRDAEGARIPVRVRLTVLQSSSRPQRQPQVPADAVEIAHGFVDLRESGVVVEANEIELPSGVQGWVTVRACLLHDDQPAEWRGYAEEWCDDYGIAAETAQIAPATQLSVTGTPSEAGLGTVPLLIGIGLLMSGLGAMAVGATVRIRGSRFVRRPRRSVQ